MVNDNLLATYSLLSFIRETSIGKKEDNLLYVFVPLVQEAIYKKLCQNSGKEYQGHDYTEIKELIQTLFSIEIPIPVLTTILPLVQESTTGGFQLFGDHSFIIKPYCASDISREYEKKKIDIRDLRSNYSDFCIAENVNCDFDELVAFIQDQKNRIFDQTSSIIDSQGYHVSKYVHDTIDRKGRFYNIIVSIYLGGLIGSYFKFHVDSIIFDAKLLIDTNFYISLVNLNTEESYDTCNHLFKLAESMGFRFYILETTIEQIKILLNGRAERIGSKDFISAIDEADILSACSRRGLNRSDLDSYKYNLTTDLQKKGITTVYKTQIRELIQKAEKSKDLKKLSALRGNRESALNDLLATEYVLKQREGKAIADFCDVNCWFLNNSFTSSRHELNLPVWKRINITASDLLTLLWLSNPSQKMVNHESILAITSLSANVIRYRSEKLPEHQLIEQIQDKVARLQNEGLISQETIAKFCVKMSEGCIDEHEASRIISMTSSDFLNYVEKMNDKETVYLEEAEKNRNLKSINESLIDEIVNDKLFKRRIWGICYLLGIGLLYWIYLVLLSNKIDTYSIALRVVVDAIYWLFSTIGLNLICHRYFFDGLLSLVSKKRKTKLVAILKEQELSQRNL